MKSGKGESYDKTFRDFPFRAVLWKLEQRFLLRIIKRFYAGRDITHLDFACGTGRIAAFLADHVSTSVGVDLSDSMLDVARKQAPSTELFNADITRDDTLEDRKFNLITAFRFFPNAQPELRTEAMSALVRHLTDDGLIVFNNHRNPSSTRYRLIRLLKGGAKVGISYEDVQDMVGSAGLVIEKIYHAGILPIIDTHRFLPRFLLNAIELPASACPVFRGLSQDLVFVCRRCAPPNKTDGNIE
jgi:ubiquinone/menaquinone biosynthesis C-methylase UbiE